MKVFVDERRSVQLAGSVFLSEHRSFGIVAMGAWVDDDCAIEHWVFQPCECASTTSTVEERQCNGIVNRSGVRFIWGLVNQPQCRRLGTGELLQSMRYGSAPDKPSADWD